MRGTAVGGDRWRAGHAPAVGLEPRQIHGRAGALPRGPGQADEHTNPTVVAASEPLYAEYADVDFTGQWASADTTALVAQLNKPMRDRRSRNELTEDRGFVFQAVMSMPPGDTVDHELWGRMARDYISQMGFDDSERKAPCRWVAIHHGRSAEGNDHLQLAVMMIREDGTWASNGNSNRGGVARDRRRAAR